MAEGWASFLDAMEKIVNKTDKVPALMKPTINTGGAVLVEKII